MAIGAEVSQPGQLRGNAFILAGVLCCALYTVLLRRTSNEYSPPLAVVAQESLALAWALLIWPAELSHTGLAGLRQIPTGAWALAAVSGGVYYGLAFWFYLRGLPHVSANEAGVFINLAPICALFGVFWLLAGRLALIQWLGCGMILAAVFGLNLFRQFRRLEATS